MEKGQQRGAVEGKRVGAAGGREAEGDKMTDKVGP